MDSPSWFIQHWPKPKGWDNEENREIQQQLFDSRQIAIHYQDIPSGDPSRYRKKFQPYIRKLNRIAEEGGYVCANYPALKRTLVGKIKRKSSIVSGSTAPILKKVQLHAVRELSSTQRAVFLVGAPRRSTISRWKIIGSRLKDFVDGRGGRDWGALQPCEQETICQEYLRAKHGLIHLLVPFGRSLEDLDVIGIGKSGNPIAAQVTFSQSSSQLMKKVKVLGAYSGTLFFFSPRSQHLDALKMQYPQIQFISTEKVWRWFRSKPAFAKAVLG